MALQCAQTKTTAAAELFSPHLVRPVQINAPLYLRSSAPPHQHFTFSAHYFTPAQAHPFQKVCSSVLTL
jgi:hypothetical protein